MKKAALFGGLAAAALPPITFFPVLLLCIPGLIRLICQAPTWKRAYWLGYAFGFAHQVFGIYWITSAILIEAADYWWLVPFAVPALAAILANLTALPCVLAWHVRSATGRVLTLAGGWVLSNLAQQFIGTGFPWNMLGSSVELPGLMGNIFIQIGALIGIHGVTLVVMLLAGTPTLDRRGRAVGALILVSWIGFGVLRLHQPEPPNTAITVVLAQGNVPEGRKVDRASALDVFRRYLALSREGLSRAGAGAKLLVWPETASPFLLGEDPSAREAIAQLTGPATPAIVGSVRYQGSTPYNSVFVLFPGAKIADVYDKWHLVPFGEYQPSWLPGIQLVSGSFGFGPGPRTLHIDTVPPVGPLICYEAAFTGQIIDHHDRPKWLLSVTNDAWFGNSSGPRQHLAAARMRSVEEGLPLLRAANTGISAGYDAKGRELGRLGLNEAGVLTLRLPGSLPTTLYARGGLLIPFTLCMVCILAGLLIRSTP